MISLGLSKRVLCMSLGMTLLTTSIIGAVATPSKLPLSTNSVSEGCCTISGTITDAFTGDPLVSASIHVKGTTISTYSTGTGSYSVTVCPPDGPPCVIVVSAIGYLPVEIPLCDCSSELNVALEPDGGVLRASDGGDSTY